MSKWCGSPLSRRAGKTDKLDYHHIFFQGKHYTQGYAKLLREHPYCGDYIPRDTLHRVLHSRVHDIPTPPGRECKYLCLKLNQALQDGAISQDDTLEHRLQVIIALLEGRCKPTRDMLEYQLAIVRLIGGWYTKPPLYVGVSFYLHSQFLQAHFSPHRHISYPFYIMVSLYNKKLWKNFIQTPNGTQKPFYLGCLSPCPNRSSHSCD